MTVLAEGKIMLITEEFKYISVSWLFRCSETVFVVLVSLTVDIIVTKMYKHIIKIILEI